MTVQQEMKETIRHLLDELTELIDLCGLDCDRAFIPFLEVIEEEMRVRLCDYPERKNGEHS